MLHEAQRLFHVSPEDKWKVFRSVHSYPSRLDDITVEAAMPYWSKTFTVLCKLEDEGLVVVHSEEHLEWRLANV